VHAPVNWAVGMSSSSLKYRTLSAAVSDRIRQDILAGVHPSGAQLRQDALAEAYGVSRIPVREALFQLESEGLVLMVPHKGAVVSELSIDEVNDVFDLRALLEPRLLADSAPKLTTDDFAKLDAIQTAFSAAIASRDITQWGLLNADLHMALYTQASMPRTISTVASLLQTSDRYTRMQLSTPEAMQRAEREHAQLIAMCRAGTIDKACAFLKKHVEDVRKDLVWLLAGRLGNGR
jgi:DNA-binding GntR family transcriptional regulator